jgi:hypothetical protein
MCMYETITKAKTFFSTDLLNEMNVTYSTHCFPGDKPALFGSPRIYASHRPERSRSKRIPSAPGSPMSSRHIMSLCRGSFPRMGTYASFCGAMTYLRCTSALRSGL